jgi:membrane protease YdiL (CAAX protease family)
MSEPVVARVRNPLLRLPIALVFVVPVLFAQIAVWGLRATIGTLPTALLSAAIATVVGAAAYVAYVRIFERRAVGELGGSGAGSELGAGAALGVGAFAATIGILALLGVYRVAGRGELAPVLLALLMAIGSGAIEEIVFRGVLFRLVEEWGGTWFAVVLSSLLFGGGHLVNPHATMLGALAIVFEGGIFLAGAYVLTRRLWLPIGIHAGWNFAQSGIFGVPTSGVPAHGLLRGELVGPEWLAGGEFGAEASIVAVVVCIALGTTLLVLAARRGRFVAWRGRGASAPPASAPVS